MTDHEIKRKALRDPTLEQILSMTQSGKTSEEIGLFLIEELIQCREENERIVSESIQCHKRNDELVMEHTALREELERTKASLAVMTGADEDNSSATYELQKENEALRTLARELVEVLKLAWEEGCNEGTMSSICWHKIKDVITRAEKILGGEK